MNLLDLQRTFSEKEDVYISPATVGVVCPIKSKPGLIRMMVYVEELGVVIRWRREAYLVKFDRNNEIECGFATSGFTLCGNPTCFISVKGIDFKGDIDESDTEKIEHFVQTIKRGDELYVLHRVPKGVSYIN